MATHLEVLNGYVTKGICQRVDWNVDQMGPTNTPAEGLGRYWHRFRAFTFLGGKYFEGCGQSKIKAKQACAARINQHVEMNRKKNNEWMLVIDIIIFFRKA